MLGVVAILGVAVVVGFVVFPEVPKDNASRLVMLRLDEREGAGEKSHLPP